MKKILITICLAFNASFLFAANNIVVDKYKNDKNLFLEIQKIIKDKGGDCTASATQKTTFTGDFGEVSITFTCKKTAATCKLADDAAQECVKKVTQAAAVLLD